LIYSIRINSYDELIKYIIDQYKTLNYSIKNKFYDSPIKTITPLTAAIDQEKFNIADYLLEKGAKFINNNRNSFIDEIHLNKKKIEYIFSNNYRVRTVDENNEFMKKILYRYYYYYDEYYDYNKRFEDGGILETYLKYSLFKIDDSIYKMVINNITDKEALLILYEHDSRDKDIVSTIIYNESHNIESTLDYLNRLNNDVAKELISKLEKIDNFHKKRDNLLSLLKTNKNKILKNITLVEEFIKNNNIDIKEINAYNFDMLIYVIENDFATGFIIYIIDLFDYQMFDYTVKDQSPLMACISNKNFTIANHLLKKGADINYTNSECNPYIGIIDKYILDIQNVKYLLKNGFKNSYNLINKCHYNKELIEIVIQHYFYNEELITVLLNIYKTKNPLSVKELQKVLSYFTKKVFNDDIYDKIYDEDILNIFLKYEFDNRKRNKMLLKLKIIKNKLYGYDNYDNYYYESQYYSSYFGRYD